MPTLIFISLVFIINSSFGHIFDRKKEGILRIECGRKTLFGHRSSLCSRIAAENSTLPHNTSNLIVNSTTPFLPKFRVPKIFKNMSANPSIPKIAKNAYALAKWAKILIGTLVAILSIYSSVVTILKFRRNFGLRRALSLGLYGPRSGQGADLPNNEPIPLGRREAETI